MVFAFDRFDRAIVNAGTAVDLIIRGQHFGPFAALGERYLIVGPCLAGEVHHNHHLLSVLADTHEAERVVIGVIAGEPLEAGRVEVLAPKCRGSLVQRVQIRDKLLHTLVVRPFKRGPIHGTVMIPLAVLGDLIAHEGEVLARWAHW